jgi:urea transporter/murein DD-endopeptidase MepM/ murein hydrolase activator NlpD
MLGFSSLDLIKKLSAYWNKKKFFSFWETILKAYSGILFIPSVKAGLILFLITFLDLNIGLSGLIAILSAFVFALFLGTWRTFLSLDYYIYNPLLVGLGIGFLFKLSFLTVLLIVVLSALTFLITYTLSNILGYYLRLPVLSIPFVVVSIVAYLASYKYSNLFVYYLYPHQVLEIFIDIPQWLEGFFKSLGTIFFYPYTLVGFLLFLVLLRFSRILAFLAVLGYLAGTAFVGFMNGSFQYAFSDTSAFNYILIATALGGVFLIPHPKSFLIALLGVLISVPIVDASKVFFQYYGIPIFAIPFNVVVLLFVYTLSLLGYRYITVQYKGTPEKTLDFFLSFLNRFPHWGREVGLPFSGRWTVWQSFNGEWTHKGPWKYALDFVITDEEGKTYRGNGYYLTDYYAYRKPVLSPVDGVVVDIVSSLPDNPPGQADKEHNWGNYVLIYDWRGFYVLLCHFAQNSIKVKPGDKVSRGTLLGLCGNSGYSPQPHIHMHVQLLPKLGAPTVPFVLSSYLTPEGEIKDYTVPKKGEILEAFYPDRILKDKLNLLLDEVYKFELYKNGKKVKELNLKVEMAPDSTFYLTDGVSKLYFGIRFECFYCFNFEGEEKSPLKVFFIALSKVPLNLNHQLKWKDTLPLEVVNLGWLKSLLRFLTAFYHNLYKIVVKFQNRDKLTYTFEVKNTLANFNGKVKIAEKGKFVESITLKNEREEIEIKRVFD